MRHTQWIKLGASSVIAVLSLGNQQCDSGSVAPQGRSLKRTIDIQTLDVRNVQLASGQTFDFKAVLPWQTHEALYKTNNYLVPPQLIPESTALFELSSSRDKSPFISAHAKVVTRSPKSTADVDGFAVLSLNAFDNLQQASNNNMGRVDQLVDLVPTVPFDDSAWPGCLRSKAQFRA